MGTRTRTRSAGASRTGPSFPVVEAKLSIPPTREGVIPRHHPLRRVRASDRPIVAVIAPPGYGKTTLLAQWAETSARPVVWLTVDDRDNDPTLLMTYLAAGLDRVRPIDRATFAAIASPAGVLKAGAIPRLVAEMQGSDPRPLIVLDDVHLITEPASMDVLTELAASLPPGSQLALGGRSDTALRLAFLRASGRLLEIGMEDLILDVDETAALLRGAGMELSADALADILARTEGWPVATYLAALSFGAGTDPNLLGSFSGADRFVSDYVWSQILHRVPPKDLRFLTRTSILDRMCGTLCDAVTGTRRSADTLRRLEDASLLLVPLDRTREWYRYHYLLRDVLRAELERREPELVSELHRRAAGWHEGQRIFGAAVEHHIAADDTEQAAKLVTTIAQPMYRSGRVASLRRWFHWLEERDAVANQAPLAIQAAWLDAMDGDAAGAERWAAVAEHASYAGSMPDGSPSIEPWIASLRALRCTDGVAAMRANAERAHQGAPPTSFFHVTSLFLMAVATRLNGQPGSETLYADAAEAGEASEGYPVMCGALGLLAASMAARGDWAAAEAALERATRVIDEAGLEDYWTSTIVYAVRARLALHRGDRESAQADLVRAQRLRPALTHAIPWAAVQTRLEMLRAHIALPDPAGARTLLREIDGVIGRSPDLGTLNEEVEEVRRVVQAMPRGATGASTLTAAELRLLPYLHTYMSFRDIAERLFVSPNTVKTQAVSLYRKLGVSSRREAMERAEELGLLDR